MSDDLQLLREYSTRHSDRAFEALVARHIDLVYSVARRQVGDPFLAEEVTQAVFILLARKAGSLKPSTILPGWLHQATHYLAKRALRTQRRRQQREQEAYMHSLLEQGGTERAWEEMVPLLDDLLGRLRPTDRDALMLRYFENQTLEEVGAALGVPERTAQKRVSRSLEKLRNHFLRKGIVLSTAVIAGAVSAHSVQAAPVGLSAAALAAAKGGGAASVQALAQAGARWLTWAKLKLFLMLGAAAGVPLLGAGVAAQHLASQPGERVAYTSFGQEPRRFITSWYDYAIAGDGSVSQHNKVWHYKARAEWFVSRLSGNLSTLEVALARWQPAGINLSLAEDAQGQPGLVLERFQNALPPLMPRDSYTQSLATLTLQSKVHPRLVAGSRYWLCVEPADPTTFTVWWPTSESNTEDFLDAVQPGNWKYEPPGSQRPPLLGPGYRDWYAKGGFTVRVK